MSVTNRPGYHSIDLSSAQEGKRPLEGKESLDVTDDLDRAASLSYTSHMPLNKNNPAQSTTSLPAQHNASVDNLSQSQVDREGLPPQVYYDSHPQSQHTPSTRNSSWDMLGGARKIGQAYEQFDSRNASEQHLAFADGDLPNSKVRFFGSSDTHDCKPRTHRSSVRSFLSISSQRVNRDAMDLVHHSCPGHHLDPRDTQSHRVPKGKGSFPASIRASGS